MNEQDLLNKIRELQFFAVELNLYLDNFPDNQKATEDYQKVSKQLDVLLASYESNFGTLRNFGSAYIENPELWTYNPWPWENI